MHNNNKNDINFGNHKTNRQIDTKISPSAQIKILDRNISLCMVRYLNWTI